MNSTLPESLHEIKVSASRVNRVEATSGNLHGFSSPASIRVLHRKGPDAVAELLGMIARKHDIAESVDKMVHLFAICPDQHRQSFILDRERLQ